MWLIYTAVHVMAAALVMYIDEYLNSNNKVPEAESIHKKVGGLLLASTLFSFFGALGVYLYAGNVVFSDGLVWIALASSVPLAATYVSYFYLLNLNPVNQVAPLFQLGTIWVLSFEILRGGDVILMGVLGIACLVVGAYILDAGGFRWQTPSRLLLGMVGVTFLFAASVLLSQEAAKTTTPLAVSFYQLFGIGCIGLILYVCVEPFRTGFLFRIKEQGKNFLGFSALNEIIWQFAAVFLVLAVASAPLAAYFNAVAGTTSLVLLGLLALFPVSQRNKVTWVQVLAVLLMAAGIFLIESFS